MYYGSNKLCIFSLGFALMSYPMSALTFFMLFLWGLCRVPDEKWKFQAAFIAALTFSVILLITGFVMGIIGIVQHRPKKGLAIAGIVLSLLMPVVNFCAYYILTNSPSLLL